MKIYIVIILLIIAAVLLFISIILEDHQKKLFKYSLGTRSRGTYQYINTSGDSFKKLNKCTIYRNILQFICIICIILVISILLIF